MPALADAIREAQAPREIGPCVVEVWSLDKKTLHFRGVQQSVVVSGGVTEPRQANLIFERCPCGDPGDCSEPVH